MEPETIRYALVDVNAEAVLDDLADTVEEVEAETLRSTLRAIKAEKLVYAPVE